MPGRACCCVREQSSAATWLRLGPVCVPPGACTLLPVAGNPSSSCSVLGTVDAPHCDLLEVGLHRWQSVHHICSPCGRCGEGCRLLPGRCRLSLPGPEGTLRGLTQTVRLQELMFQEEEPSAVLRLMCLVSLTQVSAASPEPRRSPTPAAPLLLRLVVVLNCTACDRFASGTSSAFHANSSAHAPLYLSQAAQALPAEWAAEEAV